MKLVLFIQELFFFNFTVLSILSLLAVGVKLLASARRPVDLYNFGRECTLPGQFVLLYTQTSQNYNFLEVVSTIFEPIVFNLCDN